MAEKKSRKPPRRVPKYDFEMKCNRCRNELTNEEKMIHLAAFEDQPPVCYSCRVLIGVDPPEG